MKHTLILLGCLSVVVLSLCGAMWIHADAKERAAQASLKQAAVNSQQEAKQKAAEIQAANQTQAEIDQLKAQCQAGLLDYSLLTAYQKVHAVKPVCSL